MKQFFLPIFRDEDEEMRKFIETEMDKRTRGRAKDEESDEVFFIFLYYVINIKLFESQLFDFKLNSNFQPKYVSPEEQALLSLPEHLSKSHSKKNEEMLSSQMLSGIPEVDLGIDEKIRNIEATEFAKKRLAEERNKKNKLIGKNRKHFKKDVSWYLCFIYFDLKKCKYSFHEIFVR